MVLVGKVKGSIKEGNKRLLLFIFFPLSKKNCSSKNKIIILRIKTENFGKACACNIGRDK